MGDEIRLIEQTAHADIFATGLGRVEILGSCVRFWFYAAQDSLGEAGPEYLVVSKIVMPIDKVPDTLQLALRGIAEHALPWLPRPDTLMQMKRSTGH
ncbi:hypothetical protein J4G48_0015280 [Bradyrhizobium barranii subsp. apii]|uniref:hypothetical protein n=1 Tax=Bradyrhizobium barranii TaxID=2992140 RepID=UPI001AA10AEB|nr:hypothetical protein [Bradyrhizobium barranii]UPT99326.1 hypothetical protein J4G48_0015280 [Bradyrhizobium barranii subsp. apii]